MHINCYYEKFVLANPTDEISIIVMHCYIVVNKMHTYIYVLIRADFEIGIFTMFQILKPSQPIREF